jgi:hypothetical protein
VSDTERLDLAFLATDAEDAMAQARAWARAEPNLRLRTIASCRQKDSGGWVVTVVVAVLSRAAAP